MKTNCLFWALDEFVLKGGGIIVTGSNFWKLQHIQRIDKDLTRSQFVPPDALTHPAFGIFGFRGTVEIGDKDWLKRPNPKARYLVIGALLLAVMVSWWAVKRKFRAKSKL